MSDQDLKYSAAIKVNDLDFDTSDFKNYASDIFIKLQNAWMNRDLETIRKYESTGLFEIHKSQLENDLIKKKQININDHVEVTEMHLYIFTQEKNNDYLTIELKCKMVDYFISESSRSVVSGNPLELEFHTYRITFVRPTDRALWKSDNSWLMSKLEFVK